MQRRSYLGTADQVGLDMGNDTTDLLAGTSILSCWKGIVRSQRCDSRVFAHRSFGGQAFLDRLLYFLSCLRLRVMSSIDRCTECTYILI
jgi:hypothetical protein